MRLALATLCLSGCAPAISEPACPELVEYPEPVLARAADELDALPPGSVVADVMMPDYASLRDQARACRGGRPWRAWWQGLTAAG